MIKIRTLRILALFSLALLSTACTVVGPDYIRPSIDVPEYYKEAGDLNQSKESNTISGTSWWLIYGDHDLDQLMTQIERHNFSLQGIEARLRQARSVADIANAGQHPTLVAGGRNDFGLLANWEIDLWGRIERNIEASVANTQASKADLAAAKLLLQAQLAENYFLLRVQDVDLSLLQDTITSYKQALQITNNQYAAGLVDRSSVVQSQTQLSSTQIWWYDARITRAKLEHSIAALTGKAPANFAITPKTVVLSVPETPFVLPSNLLKRRPDIAAAERRMAVASAKIGVAQSQAYPSFNIFAGATIGKGLIGGAEVKAPLYSAGTIAAGSEQAIAVYDETVANYRQTILASFVEVEDNLSTLQNLSKASEAQAVAVKASREASVIMNNQYNAGIINYQPVFVAQATELNSERSELNILARRLVASVNLIKALGGGWNASVLETTKTQEIADKGSDQ